MRRFFQLSFIVFAGFFFNCCEKEVIPIRIDLITSTTYHTTTLTQGVNYRNSIAIHDFDISRYKDYKSIIFTASLASERRMNNCYLELYNMSDSEVITGSLIQSTETDLAWVSSGNIRNSFPERPIDLTLFLRTENNGQMASFSSAYLYLK